MTNKIQTVAPIPGDKLTEIIGSRDTVSIEINVDQSPLVGNMLLTYLTNVDLNVRFRFDTIDGYFNLLVAYLTSTMLHDFPQLERGVLDILLQRKAFPTTTQIDYSAIISRGDMSKVILRRESLISSLSLVALKESYREGSEDYLNQFQIDETQDLIGLNFVHLLKYTEFPLLVAEADVSDLKYYPYFYDQSIYRGRPLATYWRSEKNILHVIGSGLANELFDKKDFDSLVSSSVITLEEQINETSF